MKGGRSAHHHHHLLPSRHVTSRERHVMVRSTGISINRGGRQTRQVKCRGTHWHWHPRGTETGTGGLALGIRLKGKTLRLYQDDRWRCCVSARAKRRNRQEQERGRDFDDDDDDGNSRNLFDFTGELGQQPTRESESKNEKKRKAKRYMEAAQTLTSFTKRQLQNVSPVLDESIIDMAKLAQKLSVRNQGRKRLEQTIAKNLRSANVDLEWLSHSVTQNVPAASSSGNSKGKGKGKGESHEIVSAWKASVFQEDGDLGNLYKLLATPAVSEHVEIAEFRRVAQQCKEEWQVHVAEYGISDDGDDSGREHESLNTQNALRLHKILDEVAQIGHENDLL